MTIMVKRVMRMMTIGDIIEGRMLLKRKTRRGWTMTMSILETFLTIMMMMLNVITVMIGDGGGGERRG